MIEHCYIRYAIGLLMEEYDLSDEQSINSTVIKEELTKGMNAFCVKPIEDFCGKDSVRFCFTSEESDKKKFIYVSPNCITTNINAKRLYSAVKELCIKKRLDLSKPSGDIKQSAVPTAGEFNKFTDSGVLRNHPRATVLEQSLGLITSTTPLKPCLQYRSGIGKNLSVENVCLIPDIELKDLVNFIKLFKRIRIQKLDSSLMIGNVKKNGNKVLKYEPSRPKIFYGNFPNAPYSSALGAISLLGAIGEMTKEEDTSTLAHNVLDSLKNANFYMFKYGDAKVFSYNNNVIDIAAKGKLRQIVDSLYYVVLYNQDKRTMDNLFEYQKFDLFASRFLQMFNRPAFKDFLSFRAEYPSGIDLLLNVYFNSMEKIDEKIVRSAKKLGLWLNHVAYSAACSACGKNKLADIDYNAESNTDKKKIREFKAKVLVELESSIFASKSGDALIAHTIARAGRLSGFDAPEDASLFMENTASGQLPLEQAKNLLVAFLRLRFRKDTELDAKEGLPSDFGSETMEDLSDI